MENAFQIEFKKKINGSDSLIYIIIWIDTNNDANKNKLWIKPQKINIKNISDKMLSGSQHEAS